MKAAKIFTITTFDAGSFTVAVGDLNENYGSDYTGCSFNTCRRLNHVQADRSAV